MSGILQTTARKWWLARGRTAKMLFFYLLHCVQQAPALDLASTLQFLQGQADDETDPCHGFTRRPVHCPASGRTSGIRSDSCYLRSALTAFEPGASSIFVYLHQCSFPSPPRIVNSDDCCDHASSVLFLCWRLWWYAFVTVLEILAFRTRCFHFILRLWPDKASHCLCPDNTPHMISSGKWFWRADSGFCPGLNQYYSFTLARRWWPSPPVRDHPWFIRHWKLPSRFDLLLRCFRITLITQVRWAASTFETIVYAGRGKIGGREELYLIVWKRLPLKRLALDSSPISDCANDRRNRFIWLLPCPAAQPIYGFWFLIRTVWRVSTTSNMLFSSPCGGCLNLATVLPPYYQFPAVCRQWWYQPTWLIISPLPDDIFSHHSFFVAVHLWCHAHSPHWP